jgi:hypothetical protein
VTDRRSRLASELAEALRAYGETSASRRMKWGSAYDHARMTGDNITTVRSVADRAVMHIESEMDRLRGEIDALRVEIEQVDYEIRNGEPA